MTFNSGPKQDGRGDCPAFRKFVLIRALRFELCYISIAQFSDVEVPHSVKSADGKLRAGPNRDRFVS